jgi:hypothetical protein
MAKVRGRQTLEEPLGPTIGRIPLIRTATTHRAPMIASFTLTSIQTASVAQVVKLTMNSSSHTKLGFVETPSLLVIIFHHNSISKHGAVYNPVTA